MGTYTISTILGDITVYQGVAPHRHQAKKLVVPQNEKIELNSHK
ncbi:hypothetical protein BG07_529 [Bacillus pseudomycoides]|nr:hypothetical protein DJ92_4416 [Bacillus pseudomycoides]AJI17805.1 hypothetical protein BG07_529 [Bacillus pseudomycoides]